MAISIIFLDIDGVLNSAAWDRQRVRGQGAFSNFDPAAVARLNRLTANTWAKIVVSSAWRQYGEAWVTTALRSAGVTGEIIGCTPILDDGTRIMAPVPRGAEIQAWLDAQTEQPSLFVILDDEDDMAHLARRLVRTDHEVGLTDVDVNRAARLLGEPVSIRLKLRPRVAAEGVSS